MALLLGISSLIFSICCLIGSLISLWPEISSHGNKKNVSWWVWIAGSLLGLAFFYSNTLIGSNIDTSMVSRSAQISAGGIAVEHLGGASGSGLQTGHNNETALTVRADISNMPFVAGINGNIYHIRGCYLEDRIPERDRRFFRSREQAEKSGYKPCPDCRP